MMPPPEQGGLTEVIRTITLNTFILVFFQVLPKYFYKILHNNIRWSHITSPKHTQNVIRAFAFKPWHLNAARM